uniref:Uncharacterized protein n=1 Tax=Ascaris lumbricoides TaxID=6252 RepID=A0A0M3ILD8_ASCLU
MNICEDGWHKHDWVTVAVGNECRGCVVEMGLPVADVPYYTSIAVHLPMMNECHFIQAGVYFYALIIHIEALKIYVNQLCLNYND